MALPLIDRCAKCGRAFMMQTPTGKWYWCPQCDAHAGTCINRDTEKDTVGACAGITKEMR